MNRIGTTPDGQIIAIISEQDLLCIDAARALLDVLGASGAQAAPAKPPLVERVAKAVAKAKPQPFNSNTRSCCDCGLNIPAVTTKKRCDACAAAKLRAQKGACNAKRGKRVAPPKPTAPKPPAPPKTAAPMTAEERREHRLAVLRAAAARLDPVAQANEHARAAGE